MDITKKRSLFALWVPTFQVVNDNISMLLKVFAIVLVPPFVLGFLAGLLSSHIPGASTVCAIFMGIYMFATSWTVPVVLMRQYAAQLEGKVEALSQSFVAAILPPLFILIVRLAFSIGIVIIMGLIVLLRFSMITTVLWLLLLLAYLLFVGVRLIYIKPIIAIREKGPIEAMEYSWKLTEGKGYWRALGMCILLGAAVVLSYLVFLAFTQLMPLYMPIDFANWPWALLIAAAVILLFVVVAFYFLLFVYPIVVFINTDNVENARQWAQPAEMHVVNKHAPTTVPAQQGDAEVKFNGEETIRLSAEEIQTLTVQSTPVAAEGQEENLQAHLDEVFKKAPEGIAQKGDEDRMPTILFDDEMAQQLEENRKMWTKKEEKDSDGKNDDGPQSIKMSK